MDEMANTEANTTIDDMADPNTKKKKTAKQLEEGKKIVLELMINGKKYLKVSTFISSIPALSKRYFVISCSSVNSFNTSARHCRRLLVRRLHL